MGPLFTIATKLRCRAALRAKGYSRSEINSVIDAVDDDSIGVAMAETGNNTVGAIGDGTILAAIIEWLKSPQGQAFIDALLKLLLGLLVI